MSRAVLNNDNDWYLKLANKRDKVRPALSEIAEVRIRDLDTQIARDKEERRQKRIAREIRPVDLSERFTISEVAQRLKVANSTIYDWIKAGLLKPEYHGPSGRLIRITQKALEDYLRKR